VIPRFQWTTDNTTFITPLGMAFTLLMGILLLILPRKYALLPVVLLMCYMTMGMRLMVADLNFTMIRILLLFGTVRILARQEFRRLKLNAIDWTILWFVLASSVTYILLWGNFDAFKNKLGVAYNLLGFYFFFRFVVRSLDDILRAFKILALSIVPLAMMMLFEKTTGRNPFAIFGGVPEMTLVRDGALRCEGPFAHPILAGTFGATLFPYFVALWWQSRKSRWIAVLGMASSLAIIFACASSGPVLAWAAGCAGLAMWRWRKYLRAIRWAMVMIPVCLQMVMKAPVWFLIGRVGVVGGSDGYHRAYLIDRCIYNFSNWWLLGTKSTNAWAAADNHLFDVTNQYVATAADGGLLALILFIVILVRCFRGVGVATRGAKQRREPVGMQKTIWALGCALLVHVISYVSVTYFDQNFVNWFLLLAMIAAVSAAYPLLRRQVTSPAVSRALGTASLAPAGSDIGAGTAPAAAHGRL
jgi:hypothetical protein